MGCARRELPLGRMKRIFVMRPASKAPPSEPHRAKTAAPTSICEAAQGATTGQVGDNHTIADCAAAHEGGEEGRAPRRPTKHTTGSTGLWEAGWADGWWIIRTWSAVGEIICRASAKPARADACNAIDHSSRCALASRWVFHALALGEDNACGAGGARRTSEPKPLDRHGAGVLVACEAHRDGILWARAFDFDHLRSKERGAARRDKTSVIRSELCASFRRVWRSVLDVVAPLRPRRTWPHHTSKAELPMLRFECCRAV